MKPSLKPTGFRVLIEATKQQDTQNGIYIGNARPQQLVIEGTVCAQGAQVTEVKVGNTVLVSAYTAMPIKVDDADYLLVSEEDLLAIIK